MNSRTCIHNISISWSIVYCMCMCCRMYLYSSVFVHVSAPPSGVPCPGAGVFVVSAEPWVRPVGTSPASLLSLPRFHTHPILCTSASPLSMGRWRVVNTAVEKLTHTCVRVIRSWGKKNVRVIVCMCVYVFAVCASLCGFFSPIDSCFFFRAAVFY